MEKLTFGTLVFFGLALFQIEAQGQQPNVLNDRSKDKSAHDKTLAQFTFDDQYGGIDNANSGRWFLNFKKDGTLKFGFWGEPKGPLAFKFDDEKMAAVPLDDIFKKGAKWKRVNANTLEISNGEVITSFSVEPNYRAGDPTKSGDRLTLVEIGGKERVFEMCFYTQYENKFKASSVFW